MADAPTDPELAAITEAPDLEEWQRELLRAVASEDYVITRLGGRMAGKGRVMQGAEELQRLLREREQAQERREEGGRCANTHQAPLAAESDTDRLVRQE